MKNNQTHRNIDYPGTLPKPPLPESPPLACEAQPAQADVGVRTFRHALFSFWHTLAVLCKLAATCPAFTVRPALRHDSWIRSVAESQHDAGPTLTRWMADDSDPPTLPLGLYPSPYQRVFVTSPAISAARSPRRSARTRGEPDATANQPWTLFYPWGVRLLVSGHSFATRKTEKKKARADLNVSSAFLQKKPKQNTTTHIHDITRGLFFVSPTQTLQLWFPKLMGFSPPKMQEKKMYCQEMFQSESHWDDHSNFRSNYNAWYIFKP